MSSFLFINQYFWPDEVATSQMLQDLTEDLVAKGHEITVLCGRGRYACSQQLKSGNFLNGNVRIERIGGTDFGRYSKVGRIMDMLTFMLAARWRLGKLPRHDAVIAMTSPPLVGYLGRIFHHKHSVPLLIWMQDVYPEIAERLGELGNGPARWLSGFMAQRIYKACARIVVPGQDMVPVLEKHLGARGKIRVIQNWADLDRIPCTPVIQNRIRKEQGWEKDRVLMYSGNLGAAHDFETVLALVSLMQAEMPSLRFVLVGDSPRHHSWAIQARAMGIQRFTQMPFQPRLCLGELLGAADAHLVSQKPEVNGLLVPSKFYGIVAAGRPVIFVGSRDSDVGRQVIEFQLGTVIERGQAFAGVRDAIRVLRSTQEEPRLVKLIRDWASRHASRVVRTQAFEGLLMEVCV